MTEIETKMPVKGWRRDDQDTNFDTMLHSEGMSIDTFLFPKSTINKICKNALHESDPETNYLIAKDSQTVIQRSCVLFINFIYHHAKQLVKAQNRKVVNADDIMSALQQVGYGEFTPILQNELQSFNKRKEAKKIAKAQQKLNDVEDADIDDSIGNHNKRLKLGTSIHGNDVTMSDHGDTTEFNDPSVVVHDQDTEAEEEEEEEEDEDEEDDGEEDMEGKEADENDDSTEETGEVIRHGPSQLELEQKELVGDKDEDEEKEEEEEEEDEDPVSAVSDKIEEEID